MMQPWQVLYLLTISRIFFNSDCYDSISDIDYVFILGRWSDQDVKCLIALQNVIIKKYNIETLLVITSRVLTRDECDVCIKFKVVFVDCGCEAEKEGVK